MSTEHEQQISREPALGHICPNCAHTDAIVRETRVRPLSEADVMGAWMFGMIGYLAAVTGRTRVRLRCERCRCQFPQPTSAARTVVDWIAITGLITIAAVLAASATRYEPGQLTFLDMVKTWCQAGTERPVQAIMVVGIPLISLILTLAWFTLERRHARAQLIRALKNRDACEHLAEGDPSGS